MLYCNPTKCFHAGTRNFPCFGKNPACFHATCRKFRQSRLVKWRKRHWYSCFSVVQSKLLLPCQQVDVLSSNYGRLSAKRQIFRQFLDCFYRIVCLFPPTATWQYLQKFNSLSSHCQHFSFLECKSSWFELWKLDWLRCCLIYHCFPISRTFEE